MKSLSLPGLALVVLALVALAVYADAHDNEFVWDDPIVFERQLPYFDSVANVFMPPPSIPQFGGHYYRPVIVVTYLIDEALAARLWPEDQREIARQYVYHSSCLVYHAIATMLVFLLGLAIHDATGGTRDPWPRVSAPFAGGLLFAVHPIHVESVAWMAGRSDVICGIFFLAAVLCLVTHARRGGASWAVAAGVLALLAMLSKETGAGLLLLAPFVPLAVNPAGGPAEEAPELTRAERRRIDRARARQPRSNTGPFVLARWAGAASILVATVVYFALRSGALASMQSAPFSRVVAAPGTSLAEKIETLLEAFAFYALKFVWPPPQSAFIEGTPDGILWVALGLVVAASAAVAAFILWRGKAPAWRGEAFLSLLFHAALAPSLAIAIFSISETPLAERYLYVPSAGGCLLLGLVLVRLAARLATPMARVAVPIGVAALLAVPASWATLQRVDVWSTDLAFWTDTVAKAPEAGLPHLHLGIRLASMERFDEALAAYDRAYEGYDDGEGRSKALNNSASLHVRLGNYERAIELCKRALEIDREYPTPYYNWALASLALGQGKDATTQRTRILEAVTNLERAVELNPRYTKARYQLGRVFVLIGRPDLAREHLVIAYQSAPTTPEGRAAGELLGRIDQGGEAPSGE